MQLDSLRQRIVDLIQACHPPTDLKASSIAVGKNHAYLHQFIFRGTPKRLPEDVRYRLAGHLGVDESQLRADDPRTFRPLAATPTPTPRGGAGALGRNQPVPRAERLERARRLIGAVAESGTIVAIPEVAVKAAAGGGALVESEVAGAHWHFPADWVRTELRAHATDLRIITIDGDSMEPLLMPGDKVLIDTQRRTPTPPGVFVLFDGLGLVAKQVEHVPNTEPPRLAITSANPRYQRYDRTAEEVTIVGRVVWFARRM